MLKRILIGVVVVLALGAGAVWWTHRDLSPQTLEAEYVQPNDQFVDAAGLRARVRIDGPENAPALLLAHGFTDSLETWEPWVDELDEDYRVVRVDLPGHGLTGPDPQGRYAPNDLGDFLAATMDALGIERAYVGGNSMGGLAAWRLAANHPERVEKLVLVDPAVFPLDETDGEVPPAMRIMLGLAPRAVVDLFYNSAVVDPSAVTPQMRARIRAMWRRSGNAGGMIAMQRAFDLSDSEAMLGRIQTPTLILWGDGDAVIPLDHGRRMAEAMPDASLTIYQGLGHMAQLEAPARSAEDARAFLSGQGG